MSVLITKRHFLSSLLTMLMLTGCAVNPPPQRQPALPIAKEISLEIPDAGALSSVFDASQIVVATWNGRIFNFEVHIHKERDRVVVAALDPLGNRMASYTWAGQDVQVDYAADGLSGPLSPRSLAAHLALIYWPVTYVGSGLVGSGVALIDTNSERIVRKDGKPIISVKYEPDRRSAWNGQARVTHAEFDYEIFITSVVQK